MRVIFGCVYEMKALAINIVLHNYGESILIYEKFSYESDKKVQ